MLAGPGRHLISLDDLSDEDVRTILDAVDAPVDLTGRLVCTAFFEPSTRTRLSFEAAAKRAGGDAIGFADAGATSTSKGESLEDTVRVLCGYADVLVLRHPEKGAARRAAAVSSVPVINAGDGAGEHPSQALLDASFLRKELGSLRGSRVAVIGDLQYGRTVHSLVPLLVRLGSDVVQVPAKGLPLPPEMGEIPTVSLDEAMASCDAVYLTRVQEERFLDRAAYEEAAKSIRVTAGHLRADGGPLILHPLPRRDELSTDLDGHPAAKCFEQAHHGVAVRQALLAWTLGALP